MTPLEWYTVLGVAWTCVVLKNTAKLIKDMTGDHKVDTGKLKPGQAADYKKMIDSARHRINNAGLGPVFTKVVVALSFTFIVLSRGAGWIYYMPRHFILKYRKNKA